MPIPNEDLGEAINDRLASGGAALISARLLPDRR